MWTIVWLNEPAWHDVDSVMYIAAEVASRGTVGEWNSFLRAAKKYNFLTDSPTPEEFLRRRGREA